MSLLWNLGDQWNGLVIMVVAWSYFVQLLEGFWVKTMQIELVKQVLKQAIGRRLYTLIGNNKCQDSHLKCYKMNTKTLQIEPAIVVGLPSYIVTAHTIIAWDSIQALDQDHMVCYKQFSGHNSPVLGHQLQNVVAERVTGAVAEGPGVVRSFVRSSSLFDILDKRLTTLH